MKIPPVNQGNFDRRALQLLRGSQSAESAAENDDSVFVSHSFSPERNLDQPNIISSTVIFSPLMHRIRRRIPRFFVLLAELTAGHLAASPLGNSPQVGPESEDAPRSPVILIGILRGIVKHDGTIRGEVKLARNMSGTITRSQRPTGRLPANRKSGLMWKT